MSSVATTARFKENAHEALGDARLQRALVHTRNFIPRRADAAARLPEFEALRDSARDIKNHTLANLDLYLEIYERKVLAAGGHLHWARDAAEARKIFLDLAKARGAKRVTKGKSMISEEIGLNQALEAEGIEAVETDLGEYVIQLRHEAPSHIIAPAIHVTRDDIEADFPQGAPEPAAGARPEAARAIARRSPLCLARKIPDRRHRRHRRQFPHRRDRDLDHRHQRRQWRSDPDLCPRSTSSSPRSKKLFRRSKTPPSFCACWRARRRVRTCRSIRRFPPARGGPAIPTVPSEYHVILVDNGRSAMLGTPFEDMLRCIRCGACMNHCPVYHQIGGHAYGWVYPGPMGAVLTPSLIGVAEGGQLPNASTFCGRCEEVCPMRIPLPKMMRHWREREFERHLSPATVRYGLKFWAFFAKRPLIYRFATNVAMRVLALIGRKSGRFAWLPFTRGWTQHRDFPAPQGSTFQAQWRAKSGPTQ